MTPLVSAIDRLLEARGWRSIGANRRAIDVPYKVDVIGLRTVDAAFPR